MGITPTWRHQVCAQRRLYIRCKRLIARQSTAMMALPPKALCLMENVVDLHLFTNHRLPFLLRRRMINASAMVVSDFRHSSLQIAKGLNNEHASITPEASRSIDCTMVLPVDTLDEQLKRTSRVRK